MNSRHPSHDNFSPRNLDSDSLSSLTIDLTPALESSFKELQPFFILLPNLSAAQKEQYRSLDETFGDKISVNEVIGEYRGGRRLAYFARRGEGIAYCFSSEYLAKKYPKLLDEYELKKANGTLPPFDISTAHIHPLCRIKRDDSRPEKRSSRKHRSDDEGFNSDSGKEESDDEDEDENYDGPSSRRPLARKAKPKAELPFSPRKSRSHKVLTIEDSDSDIEYMGSTASRRQSTTRRSTRTRTTTKVLLDDDDDFIDDEDYQSTPKSRSKSSAKKKAPRVKVIPPQYGRIRSISAIDQDPFPDDEDNETLRRHRDICEKCHRKPTHLLLVDSRRGKGKKRRRGPDDDLEESSDDEERLNRLGGWIQCLKCPVSAHWGCLAATQQDEVLKAIRENERKEREQTSNGDPLPKMRYLNVESATEFICGACNRGGICMGCGETALEPRTDAPSTTTRDQDKDVDMEANDLQNKLVAEPAKQLLFRCFTCKRLAHYQHLPLPRSLSSDAGVAEIADHYQDSKSWLCFDCSSFRYKLDKILAWRPYPSTAKENIPDGQTANYKLPLPREYLVKWEGRSYRRLQWVPHMWLVSTNPGKLKNFITGGTKVELLKEAVEMSEDAMEVDPVEPTALFDKDSRASSKAQENKLESVLSPMLDAEKRIPPAWKTVDRVLSILLWAPAQEKQPKRKGKKKVVLESSDDEDEDSPRKEVSRLAFEKGEQPPAEFTASVAEWEETNKKLSLSDISQVVWVFIKWEDLGYEQATWDAPPKPGEPGYEAFEKAFQRFLASREVKIPKRDKNTASKPEKRSDTVPRGLKLSNAAQLKLGQPAHLTLMPFQVDGFNWLSNNWWKGQHCILADEMGLGKTVQIATFLANIVKVCDAMPSLVVVPNSTITNWVREFERWAPHLRVVPFYGDKISREIIKKFELYHEEPIQGYSTTKFHILVTTYETITNAKDAFYVFKNQPRWEVLVIDEGQRLKNDNSLIFRKLNELNTMHRIIMTGTPLNNNIRELFNLMNFLDPGEWSDLEGLAKKFEVLDEELVKELHGRLRPYFLRRIKSEVLDLPPKNEVIVPLSMAPLQKEIYRSILSHNFDILSGLAKSNVRLINKGRLNNVLMELRKCIQHPYLTSEDIEPRNLTTQETHDKLVDASSKLRFLKLLLPKLKEQGNRVLLFSQFRIALNIVEDFLYGEGYKYLRLDGETKSADRQKAMDAFNEPGSDYFIFLLTTRAGGVGINLFTADTVIIYDPDFNPHQDLQAIARAYRYGQQKTCVVFKLMVKDSAEERIVQIGKKKMVLDHLIVQKINDEEDGVGDDIQSILTHGAQALFDADQSARDITYSDQDVVNLIEKTKNEAVKETSKATGGGFNFSFAKVWAADKDGFEEVEEEPEQTDSWAQALQKLSEDRLKAQEATNSASGRGVRRRAADIAKTKMQADAEMINGRPKKVKSKKKSLPSGSEGSAYGGMEVDSSSDSDVDAVPDDFEPTLTPQASNIPQDIVDCGLCGLQHGEKECPMVNNSKNLAEYRAMLMVNADNEPYEERLKAIRAIEEILNERGQLHLLAGQPLRPVGGPTVAPQAKKLKTGSNTTPSNIPTNSRAGSSTKKIKAPPTSCPICGQPHLVKDCGEVIGGTMSKLVSLIQMLENNGNRESMLAAQTLRSILAKEKGKEMMASAT